MNDANHFRPDQAGEFPFTTEVEMLLGGIGRAMYPDGTLQFADQDCTRSPCIRRDSTSRRSKRFVSSTSSGTELTTSSTKRRSRSTKPQP
jgi:hypothetical protein